MPEITGYGKTLKVKEGDNKFMSFCIDDEKLLEKYKAIKDIKTKIKAYGDKVYTNF